MHEFAPFVGLLIFSAAIAAVLHRDKISSKKLLKEGKLVQAVVVDDRAISKNNAATGLTYQFTDDKGRKITNTVRADLDLWKLKNGDTLRVIYHPKKSSVNYPEIFLL